MSKVDRRKVLKVAGAAGTAAAASTLAAPAIAQSSPELRWRLTASWPKSLDTLYGGPENFAKYVSEMTDGKFQVQCFAGGEIVPPLQATDAVINGTVEMCHTAQYYMWGKDPTWAFGCAVPFGLNARQQNAWWYDGGGEQLLNAFHAKHNVYSLLCGNTNAQMGGWFRKELNNLDDMKGVKMRIGGFAGAVMSKVGVIPQQIGGADIYPALEKGTIDGAEWVGPYDDEKLGFYKVAKYYYYPGWWEGGAMLSLHVNKAKWESLPKNYQAICKAAAAHANNVMQAKYEVLNPPAIKRLVANGVQLRPFSEQILDAVYKAANEVYADISSKNEDFKKVFEHMKAFRAESYLWQQLPDNTFDTFMMIQQRKNNL